MPADKPWKEGVGPPNRMIDPEACLFKHELKLGRGTLTSLLTDFSFFTPALLYMYGALQTDGPLIDFMAEYRQEVELFYHKFNHRLFSGMVLPDGDNDWERVLWAVRNQHACFLYDFLSSLCFVDVVQKRVIRIGVRRIAIDDPLAIDSQLVLSERIPRVEVTAFGVDGSDRCVAVMPAKALLSLPTVRIFPPRQELIDYAKRVFRGEVPIG